MTPAVGHTRTSLVSTLRNTKALDKSLCHTVLSLHAALPVPLFGVLLSLKVPALGWAVQVRQAQQGLSAAIRRWEGATGDALQVPRGLLDASQDGSHPMHQLEYQVVQLQADLKQQTAAAKKAARCCASLFAPSFEGVLHLHVISCIPM